MYLKHAAAVIIKDNKVLLIKRSDSEDSEPGKWCLPNETLEEDEAPEKAVVRGVKEELAMEFIIQKQLPSHTYQEHTTSVFLGLAEGEIALNPEEVSAYKWFSYKDALSLEYAYDYDLVIEKIYKLGLIK